jgi:hypothetical protein
MGKAKKNILTDLILYSNNSGDNPLESNYTSDFDCFQSLLNVFGYPGFGGEKLHAYDINTGGIPNWQIRMM